MTRLDLDHRAGRQTIIRVPGRRETYSTGRLRALIAGHSHARDGGNGVGGIEGRRRFRIVPGW